jgi:hypothetical protein
MGWGEGGAAICVNFVARQVKPAYSRTALDRNSPLDKVWDGTEKKRKQWVWKKVL